MRLILCLWIVLSNFTIYTQSRVYEIHPKKDATILSATVGLGIYDLIKYNALEPLSVSQIQVLDKSNILSIDRFAVDNFSKTSQHISDILGFSAFALPLIPLIPSTCKNEYGAVAVMMGETVLLNATVTTLFKVTAKRNRPFVYNPEVSLDDKMIKNARMAFFSGHTSNTASLCFFGAKVFHDLNPSSKWKKPLWIAAATIPAVVGASRIVAGKHYLTDVVVGYGVGAAIGILIPGIHKINQKKLDISILSSGGISLVYRL